MADTTTTTADDTVATQWETELIAESRESEVVLPFVNMKQLVGAGVRTMPRLSTTATLDNIANGANESAAQSTTALSTAAATATPNAHALHVIAGWVLQASSAVDWAMELAGILGRASTTDLETAAAAPLAGFSNTSGTTNVKLSIQDLRTAVYKLRTVAKSAAGGLAAFFLHPYQTDNVDEEMLSGTGISLGGMMSRADVINWYKSGINQGMLSAFRGGIFGDIPVFTSTLVPDANGATDHGGALIIDQQAIMGAFHWLHRLIVSSQAVNLKIADSFQVSSSYAFSEMKDENGVTVISKHS